MDDQSSWIGPAVVIGALVGIPAVALIVRAWRERGVEKEITAVRADAVITETVRFTVVGVICLLLLVLTVLVTFVAYIVASTVFQQIQAGVSLISGLILFGLGVALGRRRSYRVYRPANGDAWLNGP